jgi:hypothetical protein
VTSWQAKAALVVILIASFWCLYQWHVRKQEDAVAAFALSEIDKEQSACLDQRHDTSKGCMQTTEQLREYMKTHTSAETMAASMDCITANADREFARLDACERNHQTAVQEWAVKYPTQAAKRQAALIEAARKRDAAAMNKQK